MAFTYKTPNEIREQIADRHAKELAACHALIETYLDVTERAWQGRAARGLADRIFVLEVGTSTKTFRAAVDLAATGYGEQAAMLTRTLFESMAVARWINANGDEAEQRFPRASNFEDYLMVERLKNTGWLEEEEEEIGGPELSEEELEDLRKDFGQYNERSWTGHSDIRALLDSVRDQFNDDEWTMIQNFLRMAHQENNQLIHSTVGGLRRAVVSPEGLFGVWTGPSDAMVDRVLFSAYLTYRQTAELMIDRFGLDPDSKLQQVIERDGHVFVRLTKDDVKDVGRNDPCPCGSGRKFKACHIDQIRTP